ncbi:hypothetical protein Rhopal_007662-T1 [Rhodotorula paludigena]|uniref:Uncharacterized protein n=1 Tax=Rhodotorula paludigena TaxID=86838 RepID=A0AAV5GZD7_9BASI|nr:hypothetical protein Rhopal_007662-T1 [Rhodotorula paludigena]
MNFAWMHHLKELDFEVLRPYEPGKCFELACHYGLVCNDKEHYARNDLLPRLCPVLVELLGEPSSYTAHSHPMRSLARGSAAADRRTLLSPGQQRVYQQTHASGW